jgi:hypothetical protein
MRSLTSAERWAIAVLSGMADTHETDDQVAERVSALSAQFGFVDPSFIANSSLPDCCFVVVEVRKP